MTRERVNLDLLDMVERRWKGCNNCPLHRGRRALVHWRGNPEAKLMVLGMAPGAREEEARRPFVGMVGKILDEVLARAGIDPGEDVFICNRVACRPLGDRDPYPTEMMECLPRLDAMTRIVSPRAILQLGRMPAPRGDDAEIILLLGKNPIPAVETFHPAYLLRTQDATVQRQMVSDAKRAWELALG